MYIEKCIKCITHIIKAYLISKVVQILSGIHLEQFFFSLKEKTLPNQDLNSGPFVKKFAKPLLYYLNYLTFYCRDN